MLLVAFDRNAEMRVWLRSRFHMGVCMCVCERAGEKRQKKDGEKEACIAMKGGTSEDEMASSVSHFSAGRELALGEVFEDWLAGEAVTKVSTERTVSGACRTKSNPSLKMATHTVANAAARGMDGSPSIWIHRRYLLAGGSPARSLVELLLELLSRRSLDAGQC